MFAAAKMVTRVIDADDVARELAVPCRELASGRKGTRGGHLYCEIDLDGVTALWCVPEACIADRVLLDSYGGGTVV